MRVLRAREFRKKIRWRPTFLHEMRKTYEVAAAHQEASTRENGVWVANEIMKNLT